MLANFGSKLLLLRQISQYSHKEMLWYTQGAFHQFNKPMETVTVLNMRDFMAMRGQIDQLQECLYWTTSSTLPVIRRLLIDNTACNVITSWFIQDAPFTDYTQFISCLTHVRTYSLYSCPFYGLFTSPVVVYIPELWFKFMFAMAGITRNRTVKE